MRIAAAPRWAVSFADLGLLLLGCFVFLHATTQERQVTPPADALVSQRGLPVDDWFEDGEARLSAGGRRATVRMAAAHRGENLLIISTGTPAASARLDAFELAAARTAAVARALQEGGAAEVAIRMAERRASEQRVSVQPETLR